MVDNKLCYDQHVSELSWTKIWFQKSLGKEQGKSEYERAKSNNRDTNGMI